MDEISDAEMEARIRIGKRASGLLTGISVFLFAIPIVFVVGAYLFWSLAMGMTD